jgi:hypothetical protein
MTNQKVFRGSQVIEDKAHIPHPERVNLQALLSQSKKRKLIQNYWDGSELKYFVASFELLDKYFEANNEVAVRVVNIQDQDIVEASWIPFSGDTNISPEDLNNPNVQFFILNRDDYDVDMQGKVKLKLVTGANALTARLAKDKSKYFVIITATTVKFRNKGTGFGNGGSSGNIKIPTG